MKRINLAKGKKVETVEDFKKVFCTFDIDKKTATIKNLQHTIDTGFSPTNKKVPVDQVKAIESLHNWCMLNLFVGDELCPA